MHKKRFEQKAKQSKAKQSKAKHKQYTGCNGTIIGREGGTYRIASHRRRLFLIDPRTRGQVRMSHSGRLEFSLHGALSVDEDEYRGVESGHSSLELEVLNPKRPKESRD